MSWEASSAQQGTLHAGTVVYGTHQFLSKHELVFRSPEAIKVFARARPRSWVKIVTYMLTRDVQGNDVTYWYRVKKRYLQQDSQPETIFVGDLFPKVPHQPRPMRVSLQNIRRAYVGVRGFKRRRQSVIATMDKLAASSRTRLSALRGTLPLSIAIQPRRPIDMSLVAMFVRTSAYTKCAIAEHILKEVIMDCTDGSLLWLQIEIDKKQPWPGITMRSVRRLLKDVGLCKQRFFMVLVRIWCTGDNAGHANLLVFDTENKEVERFEPAGVKPVVGPRIEASALLSAPAKIREYVTRVAKQASRTRLRKEGSITSYVVDFMIEHQIANALGFAYVAPSNDACPMQWHHEAKQINALLYNHVLMSDLKEHQGTCQLWCLFYAHARASNPHMSRFEVHRAIAEWLKTNPDSVHLEYTYLAYVLSSLKSMPALF